MCDVTMEALEEVREERDEARAEVERLTRERDEVRAQLEASKAVRAQAAAFVRQGTAAMRQRDAALAGQETAVVMLCEAEGEVDRLRALAERFMAYRLRDRGRADHACQRCYPEGTANMPGFVCPWHEAIDYFANEGGGAAA